MPASRSKALHLPAAEYWLLMAHMQVLFCTSHSLPALPGASSPLRNGQKQGTKNKPPCLYSGWPLRWKLRSRGPYGGCHQWPPLQCVHKSTSPSASIFPVQMLFPVIMHINLPLSLFPRVTRFKTVDIESRPNKMLKWSFRIPRLAQCLRVHLTEQGTQVQNHMPQSLQDTHHQTL